MTSGAFPLKSSLPVAIVGAGPVGLTTALGLAYYNIPFVLFEAKAHTHFDRDGMRTSI
jgi:2-polyprenyl-6-methoxyphenol hydroxylase-like FAD-dependent oxidoreductase